LKAIDGIKAEQVKKADVEAIAGDKVKSAIDPISAQVADIAKTVNALNEKEAAVNQPKMSRNLVKELGEQLAKNIDGHRLKEFKLGTVSDVQMALKAAGTMTVADDLTAGSAVSTYDLSVAQLPARKVNFRSLVGITPSGTGIFQFPREVAKEGSIAAQTAGAKKSLINARFAMITVNAEYLAGLAPVAKQMMQDLPFVEGFMPPFLWKEYLKAEDAAFYTTLSGAATGSTTVTGTPTSDIEKIMGYVANLRVPDYEPTGIVMTPADVYKLFINVGATSGDYTLPPGVVLSNSGAISIFGIPVYQTTFIPEDKVLVGDWSQATIVQTDGLSISTDDRGDNFDNNTVTWKIEARVALAVKQPGAFIFADL